MKRKTWKPHVRLSTLCGQCTVSHKTYVSRSEAILSAWCTFSGIEYDSHSRASLSAGSFALKNWAYRTVYSKTSKQFLCRPYRIIAPRRTLQQALGHRYSCDCARQIQRLHIVNLWKPYLSELNATRKLWLECFGDYTIIIFVHCRFYHVKTSRMENFPLELFAKTFGPNVLPPASFQMLKLTEKKRNILSLPPAVQRYATMYKLYRTPQRSILYFRHFILTHLQPL